MYASRFRRARLRRDYHTLPNPRTRSLSSTCGRANPRTYCCSGRPSDRAASSGTSARPYGSPSRRVLRK